LKPSRIRIDIPILSETATDQEIKAAWENLCELQNGLGEEQKEVARLLKILYDKHEFLKNRAISPKIDIEGCSEVIGEEKSRSLMKNLSQEKAALVSNQSLLSEVDQWRSR
jgi:hypothetical protein